jgi:gliding-associated putative ABC transporter substrate-binding component GldG
MKTKKISTTIILVAFIVVIICMLSESYKFRLDLTKGKQYTLSKATRDILNKLEMPVTVTVYFSKNLPLRIGNISGELRDLLIEYGYRSKGMVVYKFINPNESDVMEKEAVQNGIHPIMINVREKDQIKKQKAFLGAVVTMNKEKEIIPFFQPGSGMEYSLSSAIKKLSITDKPPIALIQGHGEPFISDMMQVYNELSVLYKVETLTLTDTSTIPGRFKTIAIIRPRDTIPPSQLMILDKYLARGGSLFLAMNRVAGNFTIASGTAVSVGMEAWLKNRGVTIEDNFIIDASCGSAEIQQQQGNYSIQFPYLPIIHKFADNPITKGLESVSLQFASPIIFSGDSLIKFTPIAFSSDKSGSLKTPIQFDLQKQWQLSDFPMSSLVVAGILQGKLSGNSNSKIVLVSNGDFAVETSQRRNQLPPDNISLLVNSVDWLSDETGLIELRTKEVTSRPLKHLENSTIGLLKWFNFLAPIILIIIYGLIRMQINHWKRTKRMEVVNE